MKQPAITPVQTTEIPDILPVQECSCSPGEDLHRPEDLLALNIDRIRLRGQRGVMAKAPVEADGSGPGPGIGHSP